MFLDVVSVSLNIVQCTRTPRIRNIDLFENGAPYEKRKKEKKNGALHFPFIFSRRVTNRNTRCIFVPVSPRSRRNRVFLSNESILSRNKNTGESSPLPFKESRLPRGTYFKNFLITRTCAPFEETLERSFHHRAKKHFPSPFRDLFRFEYFEKHG